MEPVNGKKNGASTMSDFAEPLAPPPAPSPPPEAIADLAEACVRYVERAVGVKLDYQPETLSLLDHYVAQARAGARAQPEILSVLAQTCGAYLGEVVRRRYASWWRLDGSDPAEWMIEFEAVYLAFSPVRLVLEAVLRVAPTESGGKEASPDEGGEGEEGTRDADDRDASQVGDAGENEVAQLELEEEDHVAVAARLAELPPVSDEEFYAPSTRLEVIDIAVEAIRARRMAAGEQVDVTLSPEDYDPRS